MHSKSMRGQECKQISKEKPIQNRENKRNLNIEPYMMEASQRKKKKKEEKKKRENSRHPLRPFGSGVGRPHQVCFGDVGLATTVIRVKHTVPVRTPISGKIKPVTKGNSICTNLEELDMDNGARVLPAAKTTAFFWQSWCSPPQEQISGTS